jgi:hypothetical protein
MAGPIKPDMDLGREVRRMTLKKIKKLFQKEEDGILDSAEQKLYEAVLIKLSGTALPRINEHTGEEGGPINISFDPTFKEYANSTSGTTGDSKEQG